jgi:prepilin peptidase CpaA
MISQMAAFSGLLLFTGAMIYAALQDVVTLTIRNQLVLALLAGYAVLAPLAGFGLAQMGMGLAVAFSVLAVTFTLFSFGWIGGGDAKFAAAAALWLGAEGTLVFLVYATLIGGVLAMALLTFRRAPLPAQLYGLPWVARLRSPDTGLPYALAMAPAALLVVPSTPWFTLLG